MFEKILLPLDTSPFAEQAIPSVIELVSAFHSELHLIHICEPHREVEAGACQDYLDQQAEKIKNTLAGQNIVLKTEVISGSPVEKISSYAIQEKIGLTVMSSHGLSGVTLWPLGSTVDKVLRRTGQPLLIVRVKEAAGASLQESIFKRILVPLDGSELGAKVVPFAAEISAKFKAEVVLFHVIQTDRHLHSLGRIDSVPIIEEEMSSLQKRAVEYLDQESRYFAVAGTSVFRVIKNGNVAEEIIKFAASENCSLIAISSHGHSGFESWIIGSVTIKVLHAGNKSLLFVPALES